MSRVSMLAIMLVFSVVTMVTAVCDAKAAAMTAAESKALFTKAYQNVNELQSFHMTFDTTIDILDRQQLMKVNAKGEFDIHSKPVLLKNDMTFSMDTGVGLGVREEKLVQYIEQSDKDVVIYSNSGGNQWTKLTIPNFDPLAEYSAYLKAMKSLKPIEETASSVVFEAVGDGKYFGKVLMTALIGKQQEDLAQSQIKNMKDVTYRITVDKKKTLITRIDADLSDFVAHFGSALAELDQVPARQKEAIRAISGNMKVLTSVSFFQFNKAPNIVVPEEARSAVR